MWCSGDCLRGDDDDDDDDDTDDDDDSDDDSGDDDDYRCDSVILGDIDDDAMVIVFIDCVSEMM